MVYSCDERQFIVESYLTTKSYIKTKQLFLTKFDRQTNDHAIYDIYNKFLATGSVENLKRRKKRNVLTDDKLKQLNDSFERSPKKPLSVRSNEYNISRSSCNNAAKILGIKSYSIPTHQELKIIDHQTRLNFCNWFLQFINDDINVLNEVIFSDEAWFELSGSVVTKKSKIWASEKPDIVNVTSLHPLKVGVWCGISRRKIYGPIFFNRTITTKEYLRIINEFISLLDEDTINRGYFQQDGAPAHTSLATAEHLNSYFANRIISKSNRKLENLIEWPARSPDLTSPDYFLWGYLKSKVYNPLPQNLNELEINIKTEISNISTQICS